MAAAAQFPLAADNSQKIPLSMQKKTFEDVLDCIVQLKADFFEHHQPITDDSVVLQRFCAKFEHLIQIGMKEKVSLLGRKKDYWDYFNECLASSKGSNDGIKYVKSLGENKTSLGKGRAYIRFCLVHQRLADTLQQCVVHDKTKDWFVPGSLLLNPKECQVLINSLYDLNSIHFDLSPRGYDLDAAWPSFANRKHGGSGSWNVPISRRSSITSMDAISQISVSIDTAEVDRLAKDLELAHNMKSDLIGQIGALQQEKEKVSQTAWTAQGELQALEQQLLLLRNENTTVQEKYTALDAEHVKLKVEKEHLEKAHREELSLLNERFLEEEARRVSQLKSEEDIWKKEVREEGDRKKREIDKLLKELEMKSKEIEVGHERWTQLNKALRTLFVNTKVRIDQDDLEASLIHLADYVRELQGEMEKIKEQKSADQSLLQEEHIEKDKHVALLEGRCLELEKSLKGFKENEVMLHSKVITMELEVKGEREIVAKLEEEIRLNKELLVQKQKELAMSDEMKKEAETKLSDLGEKVNELSNERDVVRFELENISKSHMELTNEVERFKVNSNQIMEELNLSNNKVLHLNETIDVSSSKAQLLISEIDTLKERLDAKDKEILVLRESSGQKLQDLKSLIEETRKTHEETKGQLEKTTVSLQQAQKTSEEVTVENLVLREELVKVKSELENYMEDLSELNKRCGLMESQLEVLNAELLDKEGIIEDVRSERDKLQQELAVATESSSTLTAESKNLQISLKKSDEEKGQCKAEILSQKAMLENMRRDMDAEKVRVIGLLKESEGVRRLESDKDEKIVHLLIEIEKVKSEKQEALDILESKVASLTSSLSEKEKQLSLYLAEMNSLKVEIAQDKRERDELLENKQVEMETLNSFTVESENKVKIVLSQLQLEMEELKRSHENEVSSFVERVKFLELQKLEKEQLLDRKCNDYEVKIEGLKWELSNLKASGQDSTENVSRLNSELAALMEERDHLLTQTDAALEDALQIKSQLTETSEQLALSYTQVEVLTKDKNALSATTAALTEALSNLQADKEVLKQEIDSAKALVKAAEDESQEKLLQKRSVELELQELQVQYDSLIKEKLKLVSEIESYQSQSHFSTKVLEESLVEARVALDQTKAEKLELEELVETLRMEKSEFNCTYDKLTEENKELKVKTDKLEQDIKQVNTSELSRVKEELEAERRNTEILSGELSALQFQLSAEHMHTSNYLQGQEEETESNEELKARISELEIILEQMEEKCENLQSSKEVDSVQVSDVKRMLITKQEEASLLKLQTEDLEARLNQELDRRERLEEDLVNLRFYYEKEMAEREKEIKVLVSDNEQIKKQIIKLTKDKDNLWHKTDQLVTEQKRKVQERWQDNAEVTQCPQCRIEFSLFTRKHHCRRCGRIYCYTCSDFWLDSPHSSKKVRVCKPCLDYENYIGSSSLSTSLFENESEDESDTESKGAGEESSKDERSGKPKINVDGGTDGDSSSALDEDAFQIVSDEEVMKSIINYNQPKQGSTAIPPNMTCSMLLYAEELESGEVNRQNEVWLKAGKTYAVPIDIEEEKTVLHWEFTSHPKDIVFSVTFRPDQSIGIAEAEEVVAPCKCDSHKQLVTGELTAKKPGIYTLVFDNTYSRLTSKKIHYKLDYKKL